MYQVWALQFVRMLTLLLPIIFHLNRLQKIKSLYFLFIVTLILMIHSIFIILDHESFIKRGIKNDPCIAKCLKHLIIGLPEVISISR